MCTNTCSAQDVGAYYKECGAYTPVPGAAVGAACTRPAALQHYRFPRSGVEVDVQEASWKDAKRAWRVWGGAHVLSQVCVFVCCVLPAIIVPAIGCAPSRQTE